MSIINFQNNELTRSNFLYFAASSVHLLPKLALLAGFFFAAVNTPSVSEFPERLSPAQKLRLTHPSYALIQAEERAGDKKVLKALIEKISQCPPAKKLWESANGDDPISLHLASKEIAPSYGFWSPEVRVITMDRSLEPFDHLLAKFLFEICNAKNDLSKTISELRAGNLSSGKWIKEAVRSEYESIKCHDRISSACIKTNGWHPDSDLYGPYFKGENAPWKTFESMWQNYLADPTRDNHRQAYASNWNVNAKEPYCEKHPDTEDCV